MGSRFTRRLTALLYLSGGLPFGLFFETMPTLLRVQALSLADIGLMSAASLPYSLKLIWSPWMDRSKRPDRWLQIIFFSLSATLFGLAWAVTSHPVARVWLGLLTALSLGSACLDTVVDGLFVRLFQDRTEAEQTRAGGLRVTAYKFALMIGGGCTIALGGLVGFERCFIGIALVFAIAGLVLPRWVRHVPNAQSKSIRAWMAGLWRWVCLPGSIGTFGFTFCYKLGLASVVPMARPLWIDRGIEPTTLGIVSALFGLGGLIPGALLGAKLTERFGFGIALILGAGIEALACGSYALAANVELGFFGLILCVAVESLAQGVATSALMTCLARLCEAEFAATQFAALSATFALTRAVAGTFSGQVAYHYGLGTFFLWTPLLCLPSLIFLPSVLRRLRYVHSQ